MPRSGGAFMLLMAAVSAGMAVFFSLYSLVPVTRPEAPALGSLFVGVLMGFVMGVQVFVPALVRRWSMRFVLSGSLLVLGAGALLAGLAQEPVVLLLGAMLGGIGFGVMIVVGTQGVALIVEERRLARSLGLYGLVTMSASAVGSPIGVQAALAFAPGTFGACAAVLCAIAAAAALRLPAAGRRPRGAAAAVGGAGGERGGRYRETGPGLTSVPWLVLCVLMLGVLLLSHGLSSFPVLVSAAAEEGGASAAVAIFCVQAGNAAGKWAGGELEGRLRSSLVWWTGAAAITAGGVAGVFTPGVAAGVAWGLLLGFGVGVVQTATLHAVMQCVDPGRASVVWNLAVDGGLWLGGVLWGLALAGGFIEGGVVAAVVALAATTGLALRASDPVTGR